MNLAHNAVKHNESGVRVTLNAVANGDGCNVTFSCSDNGQGIPPGSVRTLF